MVTWPDRAWLALLAGTVPIERLAAMRLIVTPGTILRWHRDIVRRRWARRSRRGRSGRPATHRKVRSLVLRLARENESWGYPGARSRTPSGRGALTNHSRRLDHSWVGLRTCGRRSGDWCGSGLGWCP